MYSEMKRRDEQRIDRRTTLVITAIAMAIVYGLWNFPQVQGLLYPLRLFTTYIHEAGHGLAALLTGGSVIGFAVSADGSGVATTAGGARWLILPAGYLGTAFFGSLLFLIINRFPRLSNGVAMALGVGLILFSVLFARPDETMIPLALTIGVFAGMGMILLSLRAPHWITMLVLNVLAVTAALEAVLDLRYLMSNTGAARGVIVNDVAAFSRDILPLVPTSVIALSWAAIAVMMFATAFYFGVWKTFTRSIDDEYYGY